MQRALRLAAPVLALGIAVGLSPAATGSQAAGGWTVAHERRIPSSTYSATLACATRWRCIGAADQQSPWHTRLFALAHGRVRVVATQSDGHAYLGADCGDSSHCLLVGTGSKGALIVPWTDGRPQPTIRSTRVEELDGVACPTASRCVAVGTNAGLGAVAVLDKDGTIEQAQDSSEQSEFGGVACWSTQDCLAVGDDLRGNAVSAVVTGGQPSALTTVRRHAVLDKVGCEADGRCVAAGSTTSGKGIVAMFDDGALGSVRVVSQFLYGAACPPGTSCLVTGATSPDRGATGIVRTVAGGRIGQALRVPAPTAWAISVARPPTAASCPAVTASTVTCWCSRGADAARIVGALVEQQPPTGLVEPPQRAAQRGAVWPLDAIGEQDHAG
jgi:hypothetical protein